MSRQIGFFRDSFPQPGGFVPPVDERITAKELKLLSDCEKEDDFIKLKLSAGVVTVTYNNGVELKYKGDHVSARQIYRDGLPIGNPKIYIDGFHVGEIYEPRLISINGVMPQEQKKERSNCRCTMM